MVFDADALLAGLRGRLLCLQIARHAWLSADPADNRLHEVLFFAAHAFDRGKSVMFGPGADSPETWPEHSPERVAELLRSTRWVPLTTRVLIDAIDHVTTSARYWQEPDGEDDLCALPTVGEALRPIAERIVVAPETAWWVSPVDLANQMTVSFVRDDDEHTLSSSYLRPGDALRQWHDEVTAEEATALRDRPRGVRSNWSGTWWSAPVCSIPTSTRMLDDLGPVGLTALEDGFGDTVADVTPLGCRRPPRVFEIDGADAWAELCRRYPLETTASHRHEWYRATGRDGRWVQPDFSAASADFDAVHLSVAGYLTSAGLAIPVDAGIASVVAGWNPDETHWLTDAAVPIGAPERWSRDDDTEVWRRHEH